MSGSFRAHGGGLRYLFTNFTLTSHSSSEFGSKLIQESGAVREVGVCRTVLVKSISICRSPVPVPLEGSLLPLLLWSPSLRSSLRSISSFFATLIFPNLFGASAGLGMGSTCGRNELAILEKESESSWVLSAECRFSLLTFLCIRCLFICTSLVTCL